MKSTVLLSVVVIGLCICITTAPSSAEERVEFIHADYGYSQKPDPKIIADIHAAFEEEKKWMSAVARGETQGLPVDPVSQLIIDKQHQLEKLYVTLFLLYVDAPNLSKLRRYGSMLQRIKLTRPQKVLLASPFVSRRDLGKTFGHGLGMWLSPLMYDAEDVPGGALKWCITGQLRQRKVHCPAVTLLYDFRGPVAPLEMLNNLVSNRCLSQDEQVAYKQEEPFTSLWAYQVAVAVKKQKLGLVNKQEFEQEPAKAFQRLYTSRLWPLRLYAATMFEKSPELGYPTVAKQLAMDPNPCVRYAIKRAYIVRAQRQASAQQQSINR